MKFTYSKLLNFYDKLKFAAIVLVKYAVPFKSANPRT